MVKRDARRAISVEIDLEQLRGLHQLALVEGRELEETVRAAIDEYLARNQRKAWSRARRPRELSEREQLDLWAEYGQAQARMRSEAAADDDPVDIEDEITGALEEVRRERAMRPRARA